MTGKGGGKRKGRGRGEGGTNTRLQTSVLSHKEKDLMTQA